MKLSQCKLILEYLAEHGSITAWEAMAELHIMRLASRIHDLKKMGYDIIGEMVSTNGKRYKRYRMAVAV